MSLLHFLGMIWVWDRKSKRAIPAKIIRNPDDGKRGSLRIAALVWIPEYN